MDVTITDAVFVVQWMASRSVAEAGRRWQESMKSVLATAARLRSEGWNLPVHPLENPNPPKNPAPILTSLRDDPTSPVWVDGEGATWTFAGRPGKACACKKCGQPVGAAGFNRLTRSGNPGKRFACTNCVNVLSVPCEAE